MSVVERLSKALWSPFCSHPMERLNVDCVVNPIDNDGVGRYQWACERCGWTDTFTAGEL